VSLYEIYKLHLIQHFDILLLRIAEFGASAGASDQVIRLAADAGGRSPTQPLDIALDLFPRPALQFTGEHKGETLQGLFVLPAIRVGQG
jgi:hypothetical protein